MTIYLFFINIENRWPHGRDGRKSILFKRCFICSTALQQLLESTLKIDRPHSNIRYQRLFCSRQHVEVFLLAYDPEDVAFLKLTGGGYGREILLAFLKTDYHAVV